MDRTINRYIGEGSRDKQ